MVLLSTGSTVYEIKKKMLARDGRIGLNYFKMFKIDSLLVMKFY
jgi:hypothetical protein